MPQLAARQASTEYPDDDCGLRAQHPSIVLRVRLMWEECWTHCYCIVGRVLGLYPASLTRAFLYVSWAGDFPASVPHRAGGIPRGRTAKKKSGDSLKEIMPKIECV